MPQRRTAKVRGKGLLASAEDISGIDLASLVETAKYQGSEYHCAQRRLGWMPQKTKCPPHIDEERALGLLRRGLKLGMFSRSLRSNWPRQVWAVDDDGQAYEARLTRSNAGEYHGFPLRPVDRFSEFIGSEWRQRTNEQPGNRR